MSHQIVVRADAPATFAAVKRLDLGRSRVIRFLFWLRGLPTTGLTLEGLRGVGFVPLGELPGREIVLGLAGRFWTLTGHVRRLTPESFIAFAEPGSARAVWGFGVRGHRRGETRLVTTTRVLCTDAAARRRFRAYWFFVRPFSAWIRREALRVIKRDVERGVPVRDD